MSKTEEILNSIVKYIQKINIKYEQPNRDGRINSSINEGQITNKLLQFFETDDYLCNNKFRLKIPEMRDWYDFAIINDKNTDYFIPVNIKVTKLGTDNLNCKLGIYFALTGLLPTNLSNEINWEMFFKNLHDNINSNKDKDYYFLVADKNNNSNCFWNSLKSLQSLVPNGNNLPFQTNWKDNITHVKRTHAQAGAFILNCFKESIYKRAEIKDSFNKYIEQDLQRYQNDIMRGF